MGYVLVQNEKKVSLVMDTSKIDFKSDSFNLSSKEDVISIADYTFDITHLDREIVASFWETKSHEIIVNEVAIGEVAQADFSLHEIMKIPFLSNVKALVVVHNHPSGDTSPSPEDDNATEKIANVCNFFNIKLIDHIIVGGFNDKNYYSYAKTQPDLLESKFSF